MSREKFADLFKEKAFVEYFNMFLSQPMFKFVIMYQFNEKKFSVDSKIQKSIENMTNSKLMLWLEYKRFPLFLQSPMYAEYKLSQQLKHIELNQEIFVHTCQAGHLDTTLTKVVLENIFGHFLGMQEFKYFLSKTNGEKIWECIQDVLMFCNQKTNLEMKRYELHHLIMKYLANGTLYELSGRMKLYLFTDSEIKEKPSFESSVLENGICFNESLFHKETLHTDPGKAMLRFLAFLIQDLFTYWAPSFVIHLLQQRVRFHLNCLCELTFTQEIGTMENIKNLFYFSPTNRPLFLSDDIPDANYIPKEKRKKNILAANIQDYLFGSENICDVLEDMNTRMMTILTSDKFSGRPFLKFLMKASELNGDKVFLLWEDICKYINMDQKDTNAYVKKLQEVKIKKIYLLSETKSKDDLLDNILKNKAITGFKMADIEDSKQKNLNLLKATDLSSDILQNMWEKFIDQELNVMIDFFKRKKIKKRRLKKKVRRKRRSEREGGGGEDEEEEDEEEEGKYLEGDYSRYFQSEYGIYSDDDYEEYEDDDDEDEKFDPNDLCFTFDTENLSETELTLNFMDIGQSKMGGTFSNSALVCIFGNKKVNDVIMERQLHKRNYKLGNKVFKKIKSEKKKGKSRPPRKRTIVPKTRKPAKPFRKQVTLAAMKTLSEIRLKSSKHAIDSQGKKGKQGLNPYLSLRREGTKMMDIDRAAKRKLVFQKYLMNLCQFLHEMLQPHLKEMLMAYVDALSRGAEFYKPKEKSPEPVPKYLRRPMVQRRLTTVNPPPIFYARLKKKVLYLAESLQFKMNALSLLKSSKRTKLNILLKNKARRIMNIFLEGALFSESKSNFVFGMSKDLTESLISDTALKLKLEGATCSLFHKLDVHVIPSVYQLWKKMGIEYINCGGRGKFLTALGIDKDAFEKKIALAKKKKKILTPGKKEKVFRGFRDRKKILERQALMFSSSLQALIDDDAFWNYRRQFAYSIVECLSPDLRKLIQCRGGSKLEYVLVR